MMKMKNNKTLKILASALCVLLALCTGTVASLQLIAKATEEVLYVEDIQLAVVDSGDDAKKEAAEEFGEGYILADKIELNPGTKTGKDVYLAYKTTTNKDMAIRDIKLMAMDSGYTEYDYNDMNKYLASQNADKAQTMANAAKSFAENFRAGSPRAIDAYKALNLFRIESQGKELLGDYVVAGKANQAFFSKMIVSSNVQVLNAVIGFINIGLTPYLNEYDEESNSKITVDWAKLIPVSTLWQKYEEGLTRDEENELDKKYQDIARDLFHQIQDFTTFYENARARAGENYENLNLDTEGDIGDAPAAMKNADETDMDVTYIVCYEKLNEYDFDENTKLGDWFLSLGRQTSDNIDIHQIYPIIDAMGENQACIVNTGGLISAVFNLVENVHNEDIDEMIQSVRDELKAVDPNETFFIFDNRDDVFLVRSRFAVTAESYRQSAASNPLDRTTFWWDDLYEIYYPGFTQMSFLLGAIYAAVGVVAIVAAVGGFVTGLMAGTCVVMAVISSVLMGIFSVISWVSTVIGPWFSMITMSLTAVLLGMMIVNFLIQEFKKLVKKEFQTDKPDFIVDSRETKDGVINVLYECVKNKNGTVRDVNAGKQWKWVVMGITKDPRVGSPIVVDKNGNAFKQVNGNAANQNGYDSVKYFGERSPGDCNAFCEKNNVKGAYLHFHTENAIKNFDPSKEKEEERKEEENEGGNEGGNTTEKETTYLSDIVVAIADTPANARNELIKRETKTYVFDHNLSQNQSFATYIGYSLTTDPKGAITDIRIAPNVGQNTQSSQLYYGDVEYTFSHVLGFDTGPGNKQGVPMCDALFFTRDSRAGDPIPADNLMTTQSLEDVGADSEWIPVSWFGNDQPYNFDSFYDLFPDGDGVSCIKTSKDNGLSKLPCSYLYFKPENAKNSGTRYLSGVFFIGGYDYVNTPFDDVEFYSTDLWYRVLENRKTRPYNRQPNLCFSIGDKKWGKLYRDMNLRLMYTWTYYPKRALTNIAVYQGDSYSTYLPYSMSKPLDGIRQNFVAAVNFQEGFADGDDNAYRFTYPGNVFRNSNVCVFDSKDSNWNFEEEINGTRTDELPEGIKFGYGKSHFLPTALYLCGPTKGKDPLRLSDVIFSRDKLSCTHENGVYHYDVEHVINHLNGKDSGAAYSLEPDPNGRFHDSLMTATGEFKPVTDIKNPHSAEPFDLSYPRALNGKNKVLNERQSCYIYIRGQLTDKPKYISSLSVGAYSRKQFKKENPGQDSDMADSITEGNAMFTAASGCSDEMIVYNFAVKNQNDAWYNRQKDGVGKTDAPENKPAAYVGVSRTDDPNKAITGVILFELDDTVAPNEVRVGSVTYYCAGVSAPIVMNGKTYFLYYTYNAGVSPGLPIEDIIVDSTPLLPGCATNLCVDSSHDKPYGNPDQNGFIHLKYTKTGEFFNRIYIGTGETKNAAMADLLSQGCVEIMDMDINTGIRGDTILIGYRTAAVNWDKVNSKGSEEAQQAEYNSQTQEAIYDIIVTCGEPRHDEGIVRNNIYYHLADKEDLNGREGEELYLYYASPYYSADYNKKNNARTDLPQDVFTGYISHIALSESDRVPYNSSLASQAQTENGTARWEYVVTGSSTPVDLNEGAVSYSPHHAKDVRIYMFAQRSDGSVKPAGEITGGFIESKYTVGELVFQ